MWSVVLVCLFLQVFATLGRSHTDFTQMENKSQNHINDVTEKLNEFKTTEYGYFLNKVMDWASTAKKYVREKAGMQTVIQPREGRKLKYRRTELKFVMKTFLMLRVILWLLLPLGIISSKILSWKAVTLSLMAFLLVKILFIKNLLTGKNAFSVAPTNFVPPLFIQGGPNDAYWKRQGDAQNIYPRAST